MAEQTGEEKEYGILSGRAFHVTVVAAAYIVFYGLLIYGLLFLCRQGYGFCYEVFGPREVQEGPEREIAFQVTEDDTLHSVSRRLQEEGVIDSRKSFYLRIKLTVSGKEALQPGVYTLSNDMDYTEIINRLTVSEGIMP